jgi:hypothetical protein
MSAHSSFSRRVWLRGAGGALIALPVLESLRAAGGRTRAASGAGALRGRFVGFFTSGGTVPERHHPRLPGQPPISEDVVPVPYYVSGLTPIDSTDFVLSPVLQPLEPHRRQLIVLEGVDPKAYGGHDFGKAIVGRNWGSSRQAPAASLDQEIARLSTTRFRSLELGVKNANQGDKLGQFSWLGPAQPAKAENNPAEVWKRVFASLPPAAGDDAATAAFERTRALRKSLLDGTVDQTAALQRQLAGADAQKLGNYLESLRDVERRLFAAAQVPARCAAPAAPTSDGSIPVVTKLQIDLLTMAMACDLVSAGTIAIGQGGSGITHPWIGVTEGLHYGLGHAASSDVDKQKKLVAVNNWYASQFAYLISRLDGFGLMKDTVCLWMLELSRGNKHSNFNAPLVMAGSANGTFRTGRYIRFARPSDNPYSQNGKARTEVELLTQIGRALGAMDSFGDAAFNVRPMDELRG